MTKNQIKAVQALERAQAHLTDAIREIKDAVGLESRIKGYAESYTIPWLRNFRNNNSNQPGNIDELIESIKEEAGIEE